MKKIRSYWKKVNGPLFCQTRLFPFHKHLYCCYIEQNLKCTLKYKLPATEWIIILNYPPRWVTYQCLTSQGLWPCTGPWWTVARCRWCRGSWWWIRTLPPAPRWWSGWQLWREGCSRPSPLCPASWWRGCPLTSRLSWRGSRLPPPWGRTSRFRLLCPNLSEAVEKQENTRCNHLDLWNSNFMQQFEVFSF